MRRDKAVKKDTKNKQDKAAKGEKENKQGGKRPTVVRDSFTMPVTDYEQLREMKNRCLTQGVYIEKGELLRAGIMALMVMGERDLLASL